jgi:cytochrome P450
LRLWNPLQGICKSTFSEPQHLTVGEKSFYIPPDTRIIPNVNAIHSLPRYWGDDSLEWKPSRWIVDSGTGPFARKPTPSYTGNEEFLVPERGSYLAWSDGVRPCPGKKFSQVEFVAAMVGLFHHHRVEVVAEQGETSLDARERIKRVVDDKVVVILMQMRDPKSVALKWVAR